MSLLPKMEAVVVADHSVLLFTGKDLMRRLNQVRKMKRTMSQQT